MNKRTILALLATCAAAALPAFTGLPATANPIHPNGQIAFGRYDPTPDDTVLFRINPDGTHEQQVLPFALEGANWSPDGTQLAGSGGPDGSAATIVDVDTGSYRTLPMPDPSLLTFCSLWTPNAKRMACDGFSDSDPSRNGIYTIRTSDGQDLQKVVSNPDGDVAPIAYSPNGKRLAFIRLDADGNSEGLFVVHSDGTHPRQIAPAGVTCCDGGWSPHGNEIVFSRHLTPDVHSTIWIVHADGTGLHEVPAHPAYGCGGPNADPNAGGCFDPRWSPDGTQIVFGNGDDALGRNIYTVRPDGSGLVQVTHGNTSQSNEAPDWGSHPLAH
ncbi:MAG: TolB protein [Nocardioidaceae bacterium]|jgi:Tol biopolymer transport system component|nr:TolB protein [Nocardioidaceae bacterium]